MSQGTVLLLSFIGVALLYRSSLMSMSTVRTVFAFNGEKRDSVQVSDTTMFNKAILFVTIK